LICDAELPDALITCNNLDAFFAAFLLTVLTGTEALTLQFWAFSFKLPINTAAAVEILVVDQSLYPNCFIVAFQFVCIACCELSVQHECFKYLQEPTPTFLFGSPTVRPIFAACGQVPVILTAALAEAEPEALPPNLNPPPILTEGTLTLI